MSPPNIIKNLFTIFCLLFLCNTKAFAQVSSNRMNCIDYASNIQFNVHFQGNFALLELKEHTYRVPYYDSHVNNEGERFSVYRNNEIRVSTTFPYDKWIRVSSISTGNTIASTYCE